MRGVADLSLLSDLERRRFDELLLGWVWAIQKFYQQEKASMVATSFREGGLPLLNRRFPTGWDRTCHKFEWGSTMKYILSVTLLALAPSLFAETLSQPSFRIEVDDGWVHNIEKGPRTQDGFGDLISIHHPNRTGVLKIQSYRAPGSVNPKRLREMTNVDWSEQLDWESWGDFSGYQHSYSEEGLFYRQWWLTDEKTIVFFVHSASAEPKQAEKNEINKIVRSIAAN